MRTVGSTVTVVLTQVEAALAIQLVETPGALVELSPETGGITVELITAGLLSDTGTMAVLVVGTMGLTEANEPLRETAAAEAGETDKRMEANSILD